MAVRIQKLLSQLGIASRRQAEQMIVEGRICLNGAVAQLGQKVDPAQDQIEVDGTIVETGQRPDSLHILLHKPAGVVTTCHDPWHRKTVLELLPSEWSQRSGLHPVGRLDAESTGALLLTNDGDLTFQLTHPRFHIPKTYEVWVKGSPTEETLERWRQGVMLAEWPTRPAEVTLLKRRVDQQTLLRVVLREGRNRQIRRVAKLLGHSVLALHRTAIGPIQLALPGQSELASGQYRHLTEQEILSLRDFVIHVEGGLMKSERCKV